MSTSNFNAPDIKDKYEKGIDDIYEYYGVQNNFEIKKLWHINYKFRLSYAFSIYIYLFLNNNFDLVYGRFLPWFFL